jgi:hypothetical protein
MGGLYRLADEALTQCPKNGREAGSGSNSGGKCRSRRLDAGTPPIMNLRKDFDHAAFLTNVYLACKEFNLDQASAKDRHTLLCILSATYFPAPTKSKVLLAPKERKLPSHEDLTAVWRVIELVTTTGIGINKAIAEVVKNTAWSEPSKERTAHPKRLKRIIERLRGHQQPHPPDVSETPRDMG